MKQLALPLPDGRSAVSLEACRRLQRMVNANRRSFETQDSIRRRAAMLRVTRGKVGAS